MKEKDKEVKESEMRMNKAEGNRTRITDTDGDVLSFKTRSPRQERTFFLY